MCAHSWGPPCFPPCWCQLAPQQTARFLGFLVDVPAEPSGSRRIRSRHSPPVRLSWNGRTRSPARKYGSGQLAGNIISTAPTIGTVPNPQPHRGGGADQSRRLGRCCHLARAGLARGPPLPRAVTRNGRTPWRKRRVVVVWGVGNTSNR